MRKILKKRITTLFPFYVYYILSFSFQKVLVTFKDLPTTNGWIEEEATTKK